MTWGDVISTKQTYSSHKVFLDKFTSLPDKMLEKFVVSVRSKTLKS